MRLEDAPVLEDWIFLAEAAELLGCSRQNARLMAEGGKFQKIQRVGHKKLIMVRESEVEQMLARRAVAAA